MKTERLEKLQRLLPRKPGTMSAKEISELLGWSLPTVYRGIYQLRDLGAVIPEVPTPRKVSGPTPRFFQIAKGAKL